MLPRQTAARWSIAYLVLVAALLITYAAQIRLGARTLVGLNGLVLFALGLPWSLPDLQAGSVASAISILVGSLALNALLIFLIVSRLAKRLHRDRLPNER